MDADFPRSAREAEDHIRQIRRDKGLGDGPGQIGNNGADLESALKVLSHDLYQTATHFLLELIQNADDNMYAVDAPTLAITYRPGRVRIDCNERGFSRKNIEAICRICQSTKSGRSKSAGFVGEKGIGFKAVFKVASTVWISSGYYSFRFDRDGHLGMIAPIWDAFPEAPKPGFTSIYLKLARDCNEGGIIDELRSYDAKILIFLRRLQRLEIDVQREFWKSGDFKTVLSRQANTSGNPSMTTLMNDGVKKQYLVWRHTVNRLPNDARRPGISSSEVVLAFPLDKDGETPLIERQSVYAFLPIRDYDFKFLLQADFLLSANREDVHADLPWNLALTTAAQKAFLDAVKHMSNLTNKLRYTWFRFVTGSYSAQLGIFADLQRKLLADLQKTQLLDSTWGRKKKPMKLTRVPDIFCDNDGRPFTLHYKNDDRYLSPKYSQDEPDASSLRALGVKDITPEAFMNEIDKLLKKHRGAFFQKQTRDWHAKFSQTLTSSSFASWHYRKRTMAIIPLRDKSWTSMNEGQVYFAAQSNSTLIPEGIKIRIVDPEAAADPARKLLFEHLGVANLSRPLVANMIIDAHGNENFKPDGLKPATLVSHARYVYQENWEQNAYRTQELWFAPQEGPCRKGSAMYLPLDVPGAASRLLPKVADGGYGFLHASYLEVAEPQKKKWHEYLVKTLKVSIYPRLWATEQLETDYLHADFNYIVENADPMAWMVLLRDGWSYYREVLDTSITALGALAHERRLLVARVKRLKVVCIGRSTRPPVSETFRPSEALIEKWGSLPPFIDVPQPENARWEAVLRHLGVLTLPTLSFYIDSLRSAKMVESTPMEIIESLMTEIEAKGTTTEGRQKIMSEFRDSSLICIPPEGDRESRLWMSTSRCFWDGESWLKQSYGLAKHYPNHESLFRNCLMIPDVGVEHIIKEAKRISERGNNSIPHIEKILSALAIHADYHITAPQKKELAAMAIFPISTGPADGTYQYLSSINSKKPWLIADREVFKTQFQHLLPMLAFSVRFVLKIRKFLLALDLGDRCLSKLASSVTEARGDAVINKELTEKYRSRSSLFFRLMPEDQPNQEQVRDKFRSIDVYVASEISQYWTAPLGFTQIRSTLATGAAFLECDYAGDLRIYLRKGYETEAYPCELSEQLRSFFSIDIEHRDLVSVVLTAEVDRVEQIFDSRGVMPSIPDDDDDEDGNDETQNGADSGAKTGNNYIPGVGVIPVTTGPRAGSSSGGEGSRFSRLLGNSRFSAAFYGQPNSSYESLPSYTAAIARSTGSAAAAGAAERRTIPGAYTLPFLRGALRELNFHQKEGTVIGAPVAPPGFLDRVKTFAQRDSDLGELFVADILTAVLGPQYDAGTMWTSRSKRKAEEAAFNFTDSQGRFSAFLMRLDGTSGKGQGFNRFVYHLDVKATDKPQTNHFKISQDELNRCHLPFCGLSAHRGVQARQFSIHSKVESSLPAPMRHVSILVHISELRGEPKILFLADPWDLFAEGQLTLENASRYKASLNLRPWVGAAGNEGGFDSVQIRSRDAAGVPRDTNMTEKKG
ncbi:uncharacterized protein VDAG_01743 [Verticillium dahliae VdLs.17]|uniref:Uncharacterized protein n=1 Tax=Verticillium dahliae (strain VdLs.17 / ATCC MYA-4575 / FGSC 10137) TaxID=498257 RepID=G2WVV7_VERDV|nr:uncharacterized protein VDAG_01743 [Verticillium dahliae VdLs.17]EGY19727.1 hypothetical protein VDAG_01743 [Verticillium dahliae VdLs.17]